MIITKVSNWTVAETVERLEQALADRGFKLFRVIDHSGTAAEVGVQMPESKLVMFGNPSKGAAVMRAAPLAGLDLPLRALVWADDDGVVSSATTPRISSPTGSAGGLRDGGR